MHNTSQIDHDIVKEISACSTSTGSRTISWQQLHFLLLNDPFSSYFRLGSVPRVPKDSVLGDSAQSNARKEGQLSNNKLSCCKQFTYEIIKMLTQKTTFGDSFGGQLKQGFYWLLLPDALSSAQLTVSKHLRETCYTYIQLFLKQSLQHHSILY